MLSHVDYGFWKLTGTHESAMGLVLLASPGWDLSTPFTRVLGGTLGFTFPPQPCYADDFSVTCGPIWLKCNGGEWVGLWQIKISLK